MADHWRSFVNRITLIVLAIILGADLYPAAAQVKLFDFNDPAWHRQMFFEARQRQAQEEQRRQAEAEARRQQRQAQIAYYEQLARESRINLPSFRFQDFMLWQRLNADLMSRVYPIQTRFPLLSGATFEVPWGSYNGSSLLHLEAFKRGQAWGRVGIPVHTWLSLDHPYGGSLSYPAGLTLGWRFEPAGMLQGELRVVQTGDVPNPNMCTPGVYCEPPPPNTRPCLFRIQYRYVGPGGVLTFLPEQEEMAFTLPDSIPLAQHGSDTIGCLIRLDETYQASKIPARLRSTSGAVVLDLTDRSRPVMRYPDGSIEVFSKGEESAGWVNPTQFEEIFSPAEARPSTIMSMKILDRTFTARFIDANGNTTRFSSKLETAYLTIGDQKIPFEYPMARETDVEDSQGRITRYLRDEQGDVTEIRAPGPLGRSDGEKVWRLRWEEKGWDPSQVMPDIRCRFQDPIYDFLDFDPSSFVACPPLTYRTLAEMNLPDGTKYTFSYDLPNGQKSWGALTGVTTPAGAVHRFAYGDTNTFSQWPASLPVYGGGFETRDAIAAREIAYTFFSNELNKRRLVSMTVFPNGPNGTGYRSDIQHDEAVTKLPVSFASRTPEQCSYVVWSRTLHSEPSGSGDARRKTTLRGECVQDPPASGDRVGGQTMVLKTLDENGVLVEASYFGNPGDLSLPDPSSVGQMFVKAETVTIPPVTNPTTIPLDSRPTQIIRYRDGLAWKEVLEYDRGGPPLNGINRTFGNVVKKQIRDDKGLVLETQTDYQDDAPYLGRNLVRLPREQRVYGFSAGSWKLLSRTGYQYDQFDLQPSGSARLDQTFASSYRGNVTTTAVYNVGSSDGSADEGVPSSVSTSTRYYNNGAIYEVTAPGNRVTTTTANFAACSASQPVRQTTVLSPDPGNGTGRPQVITRMDCFTSLTLSVTDPNGNQTCSQYDGLGRLVETALPGDRLSLLGNGIRDEQCPTSGSSVLGSLGRGPTTWTDYRYPGQLGISLGGLEAAHQHTITWTKNGSAQGTYVKTFTDGLGRAVQICDQADPSTNGGALEVCTFKYYDDTGRIDAEYLPYYNSSPAEQVTKPPEGLQYTLTELDPLARPTRTELVNSGVKPTTVRYGSDRGMWVAEATNPNGYRTVTATNLLGHTVQTSRQSDLCYGGYCTTFTDHDALGRALSVTAPFNADGTGGQVMSLAYDGLGRRKALTDPSFGRQTFKYDEVGNLIERTDAKKQTVSMAYDTLNRVVRKTLPAGENTRPEEQTVFYTYDGASEGRSTITTRTGVQTRTDAEATAADGGSRTVSARSQSISDRGGSGRRVEGPYSGNRGRLTMVRNGLVSRGFAYDALGRISTESISMEGQIFNQSYRYGYPGRAAEGSELGSVLVAEYRPDGEICTMTYDAAGKLASQTTQAPGRSAQTVVAGIKRNVHDDILEVTLGNGTITRYRYDENRSWRPAGKQVQIGAGILMDLEFKWDDNGNLLELTHRRTDRTGLSWAYQYDSLDQLIGARVAGGALEMAYGYTGTGNLIRKSLLSPGQDGQWAVKTLDQTYGEKGAGPYAVTGSGGDLFQYDANGNLIGSTANGGLRLEWNGENMPVKTYRGGQLAAEKWFLGESMWKRWAVDSPQITLYAFAGVQVEDGRYRHRYGDWAEREPADGRLRFFHRDQLGTSILVTDEGGSVVHEAAYQPYGEDWLLLTGAYDPQRKFSNKEKERFSGLYDFGARLYNPATGRWISADSVLDGLNRYAYVANNPLRYVDPTGHDKHPAMYAPDSDYAKWRAEMLKRFGDEAGQAVIDGVASIDAAVKNHQDILFLAQGILNPKAGNDENQMTWQNHTKVTTIAIVNSNGPLDAAQARSNHTSAQAMAYLIDYAMGVKKVKAADLILGTHSNGANVLNEALGILKNTYGRSVSGTTTLIMAPNASVSTIYKVARQVGNSQVAVFDSLEDKPLLMAGRGSSIDYNHISRSTRPANVHFYRVTLPWYGWNHPVENYFNAIEKGNYSEYKP